MPNITLPDGAVKVYENSVSLFEIASDISAGLARNCLGAVVNGKTMGLQEFVEEDADVRFVNFDDKEGRAIFWHTSAHVMALAVQRLYPDVKFAIGPAIDSGFYYDFDCEHKFTQDDLAGIEKEMMKIVKEQHELVRTVMDRDEALEHFKKLEEEYKVDLIENFPEGEVISFYTLGEFIDLCRGPHLKDIKKIKAVKLLQLAGAYWRGDENNKMLQRIYGVTFPKKSLLEEHLDKLQKAKERDHNKLGRELGLFTTVDVIGQGLPLFMPKGAKIIQILQRFVEDEEYLRGYQMTKTPLMAKSDLYKISGHWYKYRDGMFLIPEGGEEDNAMALRPMTCPFQYHIYKATQHSYRDMPVRLSETSTLFRNESSGEMHGLIRVRQFTISEAHLIVRPDQLEEEFRGALDLAQYFMRILGIEDDIVYQFSKWDPDNREKYVGDEELWNNAQSAMQKNLDDVGIQYKEAIGEAAFYGPKLDIQLKNVYGKEDTIITIQFDFVQCEMFNMTYVDKDGEKKHPVIIHRTSIGCYERTLAMLIEKYAGKFPLWLAPEQVRLIPVSDRHVDFVDGIYKELRDAGFRVNVDARSEGVGYKIRAAQLDKVPYMMVIGDKEVEENKFSVRHFISDENGKPTIYEYDLPTLIEELQKEVDEKRLYKDV